MGRSVSFDVLALDKASKALEAVAREVSALDERIDRAGGEIEIDAETAKAQEKLRAIDSQLARLNAKSLKVDADTQQAERQLQILRAELQRTTDEGKRVKIEADISQAQAQLRRLNAEKVSIDVDTAAAQAKVAAFKASLDGVDKRKSTAIDVDAAGAFAKLAQIGQQLRGVQTPVTIAIGIAGVVQVLSYIAQVAAGLTALGATGIAAGGVTKAAFSGISDAVTELGEKSTATGGKVSSSASTMRSAIRGVEDAQRALRDANENVTRSEETLAEAQKDAQRAVEDLDDARKAATRTLEDYALRSADMSLRQESASLRVAEAQQRLNDLNKDSKTTSLERARAELDLREAIQGQNELQVEARRLSEDKTAADAKGVEQSDQVVSAQDRIAQANKRVEEAQAGITKAHEQVALAAQRLADAQLAVREASQAAGAAGGGAADKQREAFEKLTPEGQRFAIFLRGLLDGPLKELQETSAAGVLPGLQSGISGFMSELGDAQVRVQNISERVGDFFEKVGPAAGRATDALLRLADLGSAASFDGLADSIVTILDRFSDWANSQSSQDIAADLDDITTKLRDLWEIGSTVFRGLQLAWQDTKTVMSGGLVNGALIRGDLANVDAMSNSILNFARTIPGVKDHLPELRGEVGQLDSTSRGADQATRALDQSSRDLEGTQRTLADAVRAAKDEFLRGEEAEIRYQGALDRAEAAIQRNGSQWSTATEKGRDNRQALLELIRSSNDYITSLQGQGANVDTVRAKYQDQRAQLIQVATQMGLTKAQAQTYIDKLLQVPKTVKTVATVDTAAAEARIQSLQNKLATLNGALTVNQNTGKQGQGAGVYKSSGGWVGASVSRASAFGGGPQGRDTVPGWLDPEEFVVRREAAAQWGPLLELINAGGTPGQVAAPITSLRVGGGAASVPAQGGGGLSVSVTVQAGTVLASREELVREISSAVREAVARGLLPQDILSRA